MRTILALCLAAAAPLLAASQPNIVFVFSDDHAPHAIGAYDGWLKSVSPTPHIDQLAAEDLDAVLHAWQGLGYYARARNLHKCAIALVSEHQGRFPADEDRLRALPGIGAYTAAAIAAIAFNP